MERIYYNPHEKTFYSLTGKGFLWGTLEQKVYYLHAWDTGSIFAVPDYILHQDFYRMDNRHLGRQLIEMGWSEFGIKKWMRDYEHYLKGPSGSSGE
ncbi:MAG TPA: hypothetical protein VFK33_15465 [Bacillales bacterium]|nr:hypothetical protein [Bacillales bacterium]